MNTPATILLVILGLIFNLVACSLDFTRTLASSQRVTVGGAVVEEQIYREEAFPDPRYERIYWLYSEGQTIELGRYADEASTGMITPPLHVGDWLTVFSGSHLFFWQPEAGVRHFMPYDAVDWVAYADEWQLNGHYDYAATAVQIEDRAWQITYTCTSCLASQPQQIRFVSLDGGQTFHVGENPAKE